MRRRRRPERAHPFREPARSAVKMMKIFGFACATFALAACGRAPEPTPDPALIQHLAEVAAPEAPKLEKADRLVAMADRADPDRLAGAAERLLAR
jgi:hypothetical protein